MKEEKHLPDTWIKTQIMGDDWVIYLIDDDDGVIADEEAAAETDGHAREIYVRREFLQLNVIRHEIIHAYASNLYLEDTEISIHDAEEIFTCLFAARGEELLRKAGEVFERLCELRDRQ